MMGHDYDEMARLSNLAVEAERRRAGLPSLHETQERARATEAARYVRPGREDDDHGPEMLTAVACICAAVLIVLGAWLLWSTGVLS